MPAYINKLIQFPCNYGVKARGLLRCELDMAFNYSIVLKIPLTRAKSIYKD